MTADHTLGAGKFGMDVCQYYTSEESDFTAVAGSTERHLLPPLFESSYATNQLQGTTKFPLLKGFQESLAMVPPLCSVSIPPHHVLVWELGMLTAFHPRSSNHISPCNFHIVITVSRNFHSALYSVSYPLRMHSVGGAEHADHNFFLLKCNGPVFFNFALSLFFHIMILICEG